MYQWKSLHCSPKPLANDKWSILPSPQIPFLLLVLQDSFNRTTWLNLQITDWKETYVQLYNVVAIMSDIVPCKKHWIT